MAATSLWMAESPVIFNSSNVSFVENSLITSQFSIDIT